MQLKFEVIEMRIAYVIRLRNDIKFTWTHSFTRNNCKYYQQNVDSISIYI